MAAISIIVPFYNSADSLDTCINSILQQSFRDFELIMINDGSEDNCNDIVSYYSKIDSRIKALGYKENRGVSFARNCGLSIAEGDYIMFVDSDDYVDENWCNTMIQAQKKFPNHNIVCNVVKHFYDRKEVVSSELFARRLQDYYELYCIGLSGYPVNKIYYNSVIKQNNIHFRTDIKIGEDVLFNIDYYKVFSNQFYYISDCLYNYVQKSTSTLNNYNENWLGAHLLPFYYRLPLIANDKIQNYCDRWFSFFMSSFNNVFDKRCKHSLWWKLSYNQSVMKSKEFRFCYEHISRVNDSSLFLKIVGLNNYYILWMFQKVATFLK